MPELVIKIFTHKNPDANLYAEKLKKLTPQEKTTYLFSSLESYAKDKSPEKLKEIEYLIQTAEELNQRESFWVASDTPLMYAARKNLLDEIHDYTKLSEKDLMKKFLQEYIDLEDKERLHTFAHELVDEDFFRELKEKLETIELKQEKPWLKRDERYIDDINKKRKNEIYNLIKKLIKEKYTLAFKSNLVQQNEKSEEIDVGFLGESLSNAIEPKRHKAKITRQEACLDLPKEFEKIKPSQIL